MSLYEQAVGSMPIRSEVKRAERAERARFTYERARKRLVSRLRVYLAQMFYLLVRLKTIVFGRTYVLAQMFFFRPPNLRDAWADRLEILQDGQY